MFFISQTKTPVSKILYACLSSNSMICVDEHSLSVNFHKFFILSYSCADYVAVHLNHFLIFELLFDAKVLLNGHAVAQNYNFVVFQSEATKNHSQD